MLVALPEHSAITLTGLFRGVDVRSTGRVGASLFAEFRQSLTSIETSIMFTIEGECDGKLLFGTHKYTRGEWGKGDTRVPVHVHRKATHTD